ncbi:mycothiol synthase [Kytococcus sp. Marseille-QA3725]
MVPDLLQRPADELTPQEQESVVHLADRAAQADGVDPLNEESLLALRHRTPGRTHVLAHDGDRLVGYATVAQGSAEVVTDPSVRQVGLGGRLLDALREVDPALRLWSHGDLDGGRRLAASRGMAPCRSLWRMERPVAGEFSDLPPARLPEGIAVRPFAPGQDDAAWLELNARAFADHAEQGRLGPDDLHARMEEPWFDPAGFLLLVDEARDGELVGFHWTKVGELPLGEVYVVGVDPDRQGEGLGRAATLVGLHHLADRGVETVELYVDGDNEAAVSTYERLGFERAAVDVQYAPVD